MPPMVALTDTLYTPEEYLALERKAERKSEYINGRIYAMAGAGEDHNTIAGNIFAQIKLQFRGRPCRAYGSDQRIRSEQSSLIAYPDVVAVCGERRFEGRNRDTLLNPTVVIEVLSPSTERYDRTVKSSHYRRLLALQEYVLVAQDQVWVEHYSRDGDRWLSDVYTNPDDTLRLSSIDCEIPLSDIYEDVDFEDENTPTESTPQEEQ